MPNQWLYRELVRIVINFARGNARISEAIFVSGTEERLMINAWKIAQERAGRQYLRFGRNGLDEAFEATLVSQILDLDGKGTF